MTINIRWIIKLYERALDLPFLFRNIGNKFWWSEDQILWRLYATNNGQDRLAVVLPNLTRTNEILGNRSAASAETDLVMFGSIFPRRTLNSALILAKRNLITNFRQPHVGTTFHFSLSGAGKIYCKMKWG